MSSEKRLSPQKASIPTAEEDREQGHGGDGDGQGLSDEDEKLRGFLDGKHCMDEICVAMRLSERKVLERLRSGRTRGVWGEVVVFCK